jgi:hypothetical protein
VPDPELEAERVGPAKMMHMESYISEADTARTFPEMIERVRSCGDVYIVEREGEPI